MGCGAYAYLMRTYRESLAALEYKHACDPAAIHVTRNTPTEARRANGLLLAAVCSSGHTTSALLWCTPHNEMRRRAEALCPRGQGTVVAYLSGCSVGTFEQSARMEMARMKMFGMDASERTSTCQSRRGVQMMTRRVRPRAARETQEEPLACGELVSEQGTHRASARAHAAKANMWRQVAQGWPLGYARYSQHVPARRRARPRPCELLAMDA